jgi:hypothetical protein
MIEKEKNELKSLGGRVDSYIANAMRRKPFISL